ncbi:DUF4059 family protein [Streptococcus ovuberis]|uniref:DUF4059 family protein n=1 Tax=Streptococcus ovuberis TaxID=1936207 RepID=A0A7X6S0C5_9STRE|nr:DUF4059 family protein [Streptococcus ovuberis]NKZ19984.1 DUF4059 family protein [Streptococcus ovuberis]
MLVRILSLYLQSLLVTTLVVLLLGSIWLMGQSISKKTKTTKTRRTALYEMLLVAVMVIPILSFATMGLILMFSV